jgi:hypothetical protein
MRHPFLAGIAVAGAVAAAAVAMGWLPNPTAQPSASGGGTAQQPPVKAVKLCRNCGVIKEIDETVIRGEGKRYDIVVRTEDGLVRIVSTEARPAWRVGDRVRVANGKLSAL